MHSGRPDPADAPPVTWPAWSYAVAAVVVTLAAAWVLWPIPSGVMPRSADHMVHMARADQLADVLAQGQLRGWSDRWFFGTPIGELYPPLGDLLVIGLRVLSFGRASWPSCYALAFFVAFAVQGWAMLRAGRALGLGPVPGLIAGLLILLDPGYSREGGWMYTVWFGVWPQVLANALCWLAFAEFALATAPRHGESAEVAARRRARGLVIAGVWLGLALLAHPIVLPMAVLGLPALALTLGARRRLPSKELARTPASMPELGPMLGRAALVFAVGLAVSAWWLLPMLQHRAWMASYGWLHEPLSTLAKRAAEGEWTQRMPAAVGHVASAAMALALLPAFWRAAPQVHGHRFARFAAAFALGMWLASSSTLYWGLRLDLLSDGFTHLQYQRFLIAAKPGFFLLAGGLVGALGLEARAWWLRGHRWIAATQALAAALLLGWIAVDLREAVERSEVGEPQLERLPDTPGFDDHYEDFIAWARALPEDARGRVAFDDHRNLHWFMDFTVRTGLPIYKVGFTPGDNFVHKPESRRREVLDAAGVRYVVRRGRVARGASSRLVESFGPIHVYRHEGRDRYPVELRGPDGRALEGQTPLVTGDPQAGSLEVGVRDAPAGSTLIFSVAAYPRWSAAVNGEPVDWTEVPIWGDAEPLAPSVRESGALRGGKADGDDGSEPSLIGVPVTGDATVELSYTSRTGRDLVAGLLSLLTVVGLGLWLWRPPVGLLRRAEQQLARPHPAIYLVPGLVLVLALGLRWTQHRQAEADTLHAAVRDGRAEVTGAARPGPIKTDMLIRPAIIVPDRGAGSVQMHFDALPERLEGWYALDDDWAKARRRGRRQLVVRLADEDEPRLSINVRHRPGQRPFEVDLSDRGGEAGTVIVDITADGKRPPRLGVELAGLASAPAFGQ